MTGLKKIIIEIGNNIMGEMYPTDLEDRLLFHISQELFTIQQKKLVIELVAELYPNLIKFADYVETQENLHLKRILHNAIENKYISNRTILEKIIEKSKVLRIRDLIDIAYYAEKSHRKQLTQRLENFIHRAKKDEENCIIVTNPVTGELVIKYIKE